MVTSFAGNDYDIGLALQTAQGAAATVSQFRTHVTGGGVNPVKETNPIEETTSDRILADDYVAGIRAEGAPQIIARPKIAGLLLYGAMGAKAVTGVADPYSHTMTLAQNLPYFTLWTRLADAADGYFTKIVDAKVTQLVISSAANGLITLTPTFIGIDPRHLEVVEATASIEAAGTAFLHADGQGALEIEGAPVATIESSELTIDNGGTAHTGDSVSPYAVLEGRQTITWKVTQLVEDFDLWRRYLYGTDAPSDGDAPSRNVLELTGGLDFTWARPGAPARSIQIQAPRVVAVPETIAANVNGDPLKYSVEYRVRKHATLSSLTAIVKNGVATYAAV
jgi:hypothetical protein